MFYEDLEEKTKKQKKTIEKLQKQNESLKRVNDTFMRQVKERSNAEKGQYPKKQHTGYSLISSQQNEYRYYSGGSKSVLLFTTVFQTPYPIDYKYNDVLIMVRDDFKKEDDKKITLVNKLGLMYLIDCRYYKDLETCEDSYLLRKLFNEQHLKKEGRDYLYRDEDYEIWQERKEELYKSFFNLNVRMNGREGYWEATFNHVIPLRNIPETMRFPKKKKREKRNSKEAGS